MKDETFVVASVEKNNMAVKPSDSYKLQCNAIGSYFRNTQLPKTNELLDQFKRFDFVFSDLQLETHPHQVL